MATAELPAAQVTIADLYRELVTIRTDMASILTRTEVMAAQAGNDHADLSDHEARLRAVESRLPAQLAPRLVAVEKWQWRAAAVISACSVMAGLVEGSVGLLIGHIH